MTDARKSIQSFVLFAHMSRDITIILVVIHKKVAILCLKRRLRFLWQSSTMYVSCCMQLDTYINFPVNVKGLIRFVGSDLYGLFDL